MAYEYEDPKDEDQLDENGQPIAGTGGGLLLTAPGQGSAAGPTAGGDFRSPQAAGFSGFTDINAYLDANRDQTADLSKKVAGKLAEEEQGVRSDINTAGQTAESAINANAVRPDEELVGRAVQNPSAFLKNQSDVSALTKMRDGAYSGPAGIDDESAASLKNRISEAQRKAKGIDTEAGREELLRSLGTNPSKGVVTLDNLLLGADPNSRQTLAAATSPFDSLGSYLDEVSGGVKSKADAVRADAGAARNLVASKFLGEGGAIPTFEKGLTDRLTSRQTEEAGQIARIQRNLGGYQVWDQDAGDLGVDLPSLSTAGKYANMLQNTYDVDPDVQGYRSARSPEAEITRDNFASEEDYANYASLAQLAGIDPTFLQQGNAGKAGTAPQDLTDFDFAGFQNNAKNTLFAKDRELLKMDPATLDEPTRQKWMSVAKRAGLSKWRPGGEREFSEGGGYGQVYDQGPGQPNYNEPPPPQPPQDNQPPPYPNPTSPQPDDGNGPYRWDPYNGSWIPFGLV